MISIDADRFHRVLRDLVDVKQELHRLNELIPEELVPKSTDEGGDVELETRLRAVVEIALGRRGSLG